MGTYVFKPEVLSRALSENSANDFGTGVFEWAIEHCRVMAYPFSGYWRDIGTVEAFFEANIALARPHAPFDLYALALAHLYALPSAAAQPRHRLGDPG